MKQLANYIVLGVAYQHYLNMNYHRMRKLGDTRPQPRRIDFLREIAARRGVPLRWTVQTQMDLLPYLVERLTPGRLALPVGYNLGDSPRWSSRSEN